MGASAIKCWQNDTKTLQCIKLQPWSFKRAEFWHRTGTTEQLSQVAVTCRRIIEHVADRLCPPRETGTGEPKLGPKNYRNRLLAFADQARRNDTAIDLVCVSTDALNEQIAGLLAVTQKGIHAEIYRVETRRCLLRTIPSCAKTRLSLP